MSIKSSLCSGKNNKLVYYVNNIISYGIPKCYYRWRLPHVLKSKLAQDPQVLERVAYYNKLKGKRLLPQDSLCLKSHTIKNRPLSKESLMIKNASRVKKQYPIVYFFDSYRYTRWFSDDLRWAPCFDDVFYLLKEPSIVKSRPISGDNSNSVLLNLVKVRHFIFLKDKKTFSEKLDQVIFRGKIGNKENRRLFVEQYYDNPRCDLGEIRGRDMANEAWERPKMSLWAHLDYKFIMALEGNDVASNLKWVMSSNSLAVMPKPTCETWFMEGRLIPDVHYVCVKDDYSDLEEKMQFYIDHPSEAQKIIDEAHRYIEQFLNPRREKVISLLVMKHYFECTN